jgi:hypothetical protein
VSEERLRDLARWYQDERQAILKDTSRSWERRMHALRDLLALYHRRRDELEVEEGAV